MSATETAAAPAVPVEEVKPAETTPAPAEAAPAVEELKVEATPAPAVSHYLYFDVSFIPLTLCLSLYRRRLRRRPSPLRLVFAVSLLN